ncbi:uroporphyrinogen-III synthase [Motiliproteus sediminis]|uniref:uroporphyrinogen-III synthase n=1 Tax=Motiliproteus sediminis TaxID=1468178 RepID=UPI001AF02734|nr:uroporphyrinogen-III synthase [Motiliproteus sediminis]
MSTAHLSGWRVLVTRPDHQAAPLCAKLTAAGATPVPFPTLKIVAIDEGSAEAQSVRQRFLDLDHYRFVICISANAARLAYDWIDRYWPQMPVGVDWLAVGEATARTLNELGLSATAAGRGMNSEALLELPELQQLEHCKILICRGQGGREHLRDTLVSRGAEVDYAELYRRALPAYSAEEIESRIYDSPPSAMVVSSGEALDNLNRLCDLQRLLSVPVIVPSQRVADEARQLLFTRVITAANATDDAMLAALDGLASQDTRQRG